MVQIENDFLPVLYAKFFKGGMLLSVFVSVEQAKKKRAFLKIPLAIHCFTCLTKRGTTLSLMLSH